MDFFTELQKMRASYAKNRLTNIHLSRPGWLYNSEDPMSKIYKEKKTLLQKGDVCYAYVVQANTILFELFPPLDCPASIVYSTDPAVANHPEILEEIATNIFSYKNCDLETVPEKWREMARITTDEYDRTNVTFTVEYQGKEIEFRFMPIMVYRKLVPKWKLCGNLLPLLTAEGCESVMILPKKYWSDAFVYLWGEGMI